MYPWLPDQVQDSILLCSQPHSVFTYLYLMMSCVADWTQWNSKTGVLLNSLGQVSNMYGKMPQVYRWTPVSTHLWLLQGFERSVWSLWAHAVLWIKKFCLSGRLNIRPLCAPGTRCSRAVMPTGGCRAMNTWVNTWFKWARHNYPPAPSCLPKHFNKVGEDENELSI